MRKYIESKFISIIKFSRENKRLAYERNMELRGIIKYMFEHDEIDSETFTRLYRLTYTLESKLELYMWYIKLAIK